MPITSPFGRDPDGHQAEPDRTQTADQKRSTQSSTDTGTRARAREDFADLPPGAVVVETEVPRRSDRGEALAEVVPLDRGPDATGSGGAAGPAEGVEPDRPGWRVRTWQAAADVAADARDTWRRATTTPAIWTDQPPALAAIWDRLRRAPWCDPEVGLLVFLGRAYGVVALVVSAVLYGAAWLTQRPARLLVVTAVAAAWLA